MSSQQLKARPPEVFDQAKLESMIEPFTVRVERIRGSNRIPIPLPAPEGGGAGGTGFDKAMIMGLEQWIQTDWSGGGAYRVSVTDSETPKPTTMTWQFLSMAPERVPPPLVGVLPPPPVQPQPQQPQAHPQQQAYMAPSAFPFGLPQIPHQPAQVALQQSAPYYQYPPSYPQGSWPGFQQQYQQPQPYRPDPAHEQLAAMQRELQASREAQIKATHDAQLATERASNDARFKSLEGMMQAFLSKLESIGATTTKSPELEAMRLKAEATERQLEAAERRREEDQRARDLQALMAKQEANTQRMIEAMQAQVTAMGTNRGPDPTMMMMQEHLRSNAEMQKELARLHNESMKSMTDFMMSPKDMIALQREGAQGVDQVTGQLSRAFGDMIGIQSRVMEQVAQLNSGGGKTGLDIVDGMADRLGSLLGQWTKGKAQEATAAHQAQSAAAQAQARVVEAQASAARAQFEAAGRASGMNGSTGQVVHVPPAPAVQQQLNGASTPAASATPRKKPENGQVLQMPPQPVPPGRGGKTDEEWFGPFVAEVMRLREEVEKAVVSAGMKPPRTENGLLVGVVPEQVVLFINQAITMVTTNNAVEHVPAVGELFMQERWADFVDILLYNSAPQGYKDQVVQLLAAQSQNEDDENDEDEDDDEKAS